MAVRETGAVKWFDPVKGYGFIRRDNGGDIFVHITEIQGEGEKTLQENQRVEFTVDSGDKGPVATDVVVLVA